MTSTRITATVNTKTVFYALIALILVTSHTAFAQELRFGDAELKFVNSQQRDLRVQAEGPLTLQKVTVMRDAGGVLLQGTARPSDALADKPMTLHYRVSAPDGERLVVQIGDQYFTMDLYDWELEPIVKFADSVYHATVTATESATKMEMKKYGDDLREVVSFHPAFQNRLMGLRHLQADYVRDLGGQRFLPSLDGELLLGAGEKTHYTKPDQALAAENRLQSLVRKMSNYWILLNDVNVDFVFDIASDELVITGDPYYFLWNPSNNEWNLESGSANVSGRVLAGGRINKRVKKAWPDYYAMNPLVYRAVTRTARYAALFRYQHKTNPNNWDDFFEAVEQSIDFGFSDHRNPVRRVRTKV